MAGLLFAPCALAHDAGSSYLHLEVAAETVRGRWEIDLEDLDRGLSLDARKDGAVSAEDLRAAFPSVRQYALRSLELIIDGRPLALEFSSVEPEIQGLPNRTNLVLRFTLTNLSEPQVLEIEYRLLFDRLPLHRGLLELECRGLIQTAIFSPERTRQRFDLAAASRRGEFLSFTGQGVWHIWIGYDHILFLLALLLPAVLERERQQWRALTGFRPILINVVKIVTAFTLAHSLTLSLATLRLVELPARWVEATIAGSVLLAAVNNLYPVFQGRTWMIAFGFGLIHGFGFANVLVELGLPAGMLALALLGFNVGVELGQLAIIALFLPLAYHLRGSRFYQQGLMQVGSIAIAALAGFWLFNRLQIP